MFMYTYKYIHINMSHIKCDRCVYLSAYESICIYLQIYIHMCLYIWIGVYIYTHTHICTYIYICFGHIIPNIIVRKDCILHYLAINLI